MCHGPRAGPCTVEQESGLITPFPINQGGAGQHTGGEPVGGPGGAVSPGAGAEAGQSIRGPVLAGASQSLVSLGSGLAGMGVGSSELSGLSGTGLRLSMGLAASSADRGPEQHGAARDRFLTEELAIVMSHYDVGPIQAIQEFRRGSRRSPKLIISSLKGVFVLKRRAPGRDDLARVMLGHGVQRHLVHRGFPVPRLIETVDGNQTLLRHGGRIYELFEFIPGTRYDASLPATAEAGRALALFHKLVADHRAQDSHFAPGYHAAAGMREQLGHIAARGNGAGDLKSLCAALGDLYQKASAKAASTGLARWPTQIVHGDWHPGNTLFRGQKVVAVIDFDSIRPEPRALDVANGALQFSITMSGGDLAAWPDHLDESRYKRFCRGYDSVEGCILSTAELQAMPWLMAEALIVEAVAPIAATGSFAGFPGEDFLRMIRRKVEWLSREAPRLVGLVAG